MTTALRSEETPPSTMTHHSARWETLAFVYNAAHSRLMLACLHETVAPVPMPLPLPPNTPTHAPRRITSHPPSRSPPHLGRGSQPLSHTHRQCISAMRLSHHITSLIRHISGTRAGFLAFNWHGESNSGQLFWHFPQHTTQSPVKSNETACVRRGLALFIVR